MDGFPAFIAAIFLISLSGVLAPGPVMAMTVARGAENPHAGAWIAAGHALVEVPLVAVIYFGAGLAFNLLSVRVGVGALGGLALLAMGVGMLRARPSAPGAAAARRGTFWSGVVLSAGNPYFLVWWATAGAALIGKSLAFGAAGFGALLVVHLSCDLGWCWLLSGLAYRGGRFWGQTMQRAAFALSAVVLFYFAGYFLVGALLLIA